MTIIAAATRNGVAYIGCDRAGTDGYGTQGDYGAKIERLPSCLVGWAGSYRVGQVVTRALRNVFALGEGSIEDIVDKVDEALRLAGWARSSANGVPECEELSLILVNAAGEIWQIQSDLAYLRCQQFAAVGSGYQVALGAMHALHERCDSPALVVRGGLRAACDIIATCADPEEPVCASLAEVSRG